MNADERDRAIDQMIAGIAAEFSRERAYMTARIAATRRELAREINIVKAETAELRRALATLRDAILDDDKPAPPAEPSTRWVQ